MQKVHFRLTSVAQKRSCLNSLIWSSENAMDARERRDSKPPLRAFLLLLVFLKVLCFSFPVPVVSSRSLVRFWRRKHKKSTTRASRPWKNLSARLVGKSILFLACVASVLKERRFRGARSAKGAGWGGEETRSCSLLRRTRSRVQIPFPVPFERLPRSLYFSRPLKRLLRRLILERLTIPLSVNSVLSLKMEWRWSYMWRLNSRRIQDGLVTG